MFQDKLKIWIEGVGREKYPRLSRLQFNALVDFAYWLDRAAELPLEPSAQHSEAGDAPTLSGLYNCQLCGLEKCSQPGICKDCLSEPSKAETNQWSAANTASS